MCGIVGYFSANGDFDPKKCANANNIAEYRGPDDYGYITISENLEVKEWRDKWMGDFDSPCNIIGTVGFRRLSIIDLSPKGHQPMHEGRHRYWIVFNGEVYNYLEIRKELMSRGYRFNSETDTEVVLKSYIEWGYNCLERFNGMWSFCIIDIPNKLLFCARDRLGIKPFYYYFDREHFVFGSEIKQVLSLLPMNTEVNPSVFFDYLALGSYGNEARDTFFKCVYKILPGESMEITLPTPGALNLKSQIWWDLPRVEQDTRLNEDEICENIRYLVEDSIRLRLRSDVPVGTCLSGGLDSSVIACLVDRIYKKTGSSRKHKVFVIGSIDPKVDETHYARIVIENTNVEPYFNFPESADLERDLENFIWHHDEPLVTASMYGGWHVYKLAKNNGATVVLDGQGADELLGGYYFGVHIDFLNELFFSGKLVEFFKQLSANTALHSISKHRILRRMTQSIVKKIARSMRPVDFRPSVYKKVNGWLKKDFIRTNIRKSHRLNEDFYVAPRKFSSIIKKHSYEFTKYTSLPGILRQVDRNSMAFSVESRVPFLDYRLVELFFKLPANFILRNGYTKYVYRKAVKGIIPERIRLRTDKRGFTMPDWQLLRGALPYVRSIIEGLSNNSEIYEVRNIKNVILENIKSEHSYQPIIWRIVNAIVWQSKFGVGQ